MKISIEFLESPSTYWYKIIMYAHNVWSPSNLGKEGRALKNLWYERNNKNSLIQMANIFAYIFHGENITLCPKITQEKTGKEKLSYQEDKNKKKSIA